MTPTADPELLRLLDDYGQAVYAMGAAPMLDRRAMHQRARSALDAINGHIARNYIPRNATRGYQAARGVLPWRPGDELPEDAIRRLRDGEAARVRTLYADDTGNVVEGAADFEGDR